MIPDECRLDDIARRHRINASVFFPFVIERLGGDHQVTEVMLTIRLRDIGEEGERQRLLRIVWSPTNTFSLPLGVPEHTITEWAALGVASIVVALYAGMQILSVTGQGDRFDYWIGDGIREFGLEVSGTGSTELETRHATKVAQLLENPYGVDGYVLVVSFAIREAILSFHRFEEELA